MVFPQKELEINSNVEETFRMIVGRLEKCFFSDAYVI